MLKISLVDGQRQRRLTVEGTLVTPWASELAIACEKARENLEGRELVVDLRGLTRIGQEGESVLLQLMKSKTKLQCGVFVRELLRQLVRSTQLSALDAADALNGADSEAE
jgi:anti-anti-sigma regulatory factor